MTTAGEHGDRRDAPPPDADRKPDSPTDLKKPSWKFALKRTWAEFNNDQCTDLAAALTYYAVLALFPAFLALVSLLGLLGQGPKTTDALLNVFSEMGAGGTGMQNVKGILEHLQQSKGSGITLVIGLVGALWSASGYVAGFGRAMNRIYEIREGRPFWKLRPIQLLVTLVAVVLVALVAIMLVVSGPLAQSIGNVVGLGSTAVLVWQIAKWPVLVFFVILIIAILYYVTPNVKQPKFKWVSTGSLVAFVTWVVVSVLFGLYVANFGSYNKTYGALAGVIVFLLWLWITNLALLFGAEFDSETERSRELQAGMPAEEELQLPPRDTRGIDKHEEKEQKAVDQAHDLRERFSDGQRGND
jgi:membrane protein